MDPFLGIATPEDLIIESLGEARIPNTFDKFTKTQITDDRRIAVLTRRHELLDFFKQQGRIPFFEVAGPREKLFFNPAETVAGVVTCGGLCPGLNDVIHAVTLTLRGHYGVKTIYGFRYGFEGLTKNARLEPLVLNEDTVEDIHEVGGTILGSSRGPQDPAEMVDTLLKYKVNVLFVIGGDGTLRGGRDISNEAKKRGAKIAVVGIPKTIDNDIQCIERSFGFMTAVDKAREVLLAAHAEAKGAFNGIGLVKLMGRDSGFIAAFASLASKHANFCLIPEEPFTLSGPNSFLEQLEKRLVRKHHAVIAVAEGAGQELFKSLDKEKDASGNIKKQDIGIFLKAEIKKYFEAKNIPVSIRYIDPSYTIRSLPSNSADSIFCFLLGQNAVHAGMAGKTNLVVGYWNQHFTHVPIDLAVKDRRKVDTEGRFWKGALAVMG